MLHRVLVGGVDTLNDEPLAPFFQGVKLKRIEEAAPRQIENTEVHRNP
jgi:hypothetical protein